MSSYYIEPCRDEAAVNGHCVYRPECPSRCRSVHRSWRLETSIENCEITLQKESGYSFNETVQEARRHIRECWISKPSQSYEGLCDICQERQEAIEVLEAWEALNEMTYEEFVSYFSAGVDHD